MSPFKTAAFSPEVVELIKRRRPGRKAGTPGHVGKRQTRKSAVAEKAAEAIKAGACKSVEDAAEVFAHEYLGRPGELTKDQLRHFKIKIKSYL